jgi:hypothetical protein
MINAYWHFIMMQGRSLTGESLLIFRDQRLLAFHYDAGQLLKLLASKA